MKKITLAFVALFLSASALAWTIGPMNYQGRLLDSSGVPVTGSYLFKVRIYDAASGGTLKFSEQHNSVAVNDGVYSFLVSTGTNSTGAWDIALWNTPQLFLEIEVNSEILSPRHLMAATPYAYQANLALTTNNALALGGTSAAQYNSTLQAICVSGKGKWLELANGGAGSCLGVGAQFPGPARVNWNTLTANSNFTNLDLSRANISGIDFTPSSAYPNLTGTIFNATTYSVAGMSGANLTNTQWDGAIATDASPATVASYTVLAKATMKNMDLSKWNLSAITSSANLQYFSAAYLSACPAAVFGYVFVNTSGVWKCNLMRAAGSQYFMVGPHANLSTTSAVAAASIGEILLDVDTFDNTDTSAANFSGVTLTQSFLNGYFYTANLTNATLRNINFTNTNFNGTFVGAKLENVIVGSSISMNNGNWSGSTLTNVRFDNYPSGINFTKATFRNVDFTVGIQGPNFTDAVLDNLRIKFLATATTQFVNTRILGNFNVAGIHSTASSMTFQNVEFDGATISGALTDVNFTGTVKFTNVVFKNLDLCSVSMPLAGAAPHAELADVKWEGPIECPDGLDVLGNPAGANPLYINTCNYQTRTSTPIAVASCTGGIPGGLQ